MFNLGFGELVLICIVLIVVVGPKRLPALMKTVGKTMRTVRQASRDIQTSVGLDEILREDVMQPLLPPVPPPAATISRDTPLVTPEPNAVIPPQVAGASGEIGSLDVEAGRKIDVQPAVAHVPEDENPASPAIQTKVERGPAGQDR